MDKIIIRQKSGVSPPSIMNAERKRSLYYRARTYVSGLGRFTGKDPWTWQPDDMRIRGLNNHFIVLFSKNNLYLMSLSKYLLNAGSVYNLNETQYNYAKNNPMKFNDPYGFWASIANPGQADSSIEAKINKDYEGLISGAVLCGVGLVATALGGMCAQPKLIGVGILAGLTGLGIATKSAIDLSVHTRKQTTRDIENANRK